MHRLSSRLHFPPFMAPATTEQPPTTTITMNFPMCKLHITTRNCNIILRALELVFRSIQVNRIISLFITGGEKTLMYVLLLQVESIVNHTPVPHTDRYGTYCRSLCFLSKVVSQVSSGGQRL